VQCVSDFLQQQQQQRQTAIDASEDGGTRPSDSRAALFDCPSDRTLAMFDSIELDRTDIFATALCIASERRWHLIHPHRPFVAGMTRAYGRAWVHSMRFEHGGPRMVTRSWVSLMPRRTLCELGMIARIFNRYGERFHPPKFRKCYATTYVSRWNATYGIYELSTRAATLDSSDEEEEEDDLPVGGGRANRNDDVRHDELREASRVRRLRHTVPFGPDTSVESPLPRWYMDDLNA
jgi:hypothetical protein